MRLYLKNELKAKKTGGVAQVVECWLSKHEALNAIPRTAKKKKKRKKKKKERQQQ
jgi:hypothetical protein